VARNKHAIVTEAHLQRFFDFSRERYHIMLRRRLGQPAPWTTDPVLAMWRFCNVFREDDRTTTWFRENIRNELSMEPRVVMATIAFRAFNRVETGEILKPFLLNEDYNFPEWRRLLTERAEANFPVVTGAYMIKTAPKLNKIDGVLYQLSEAKMREASIMDWIRNNDWGFCTQESLWELLCTFPYIGQFTANEVVVDLTHTHILRAARDLDTWTNPGPGCSLGIGMLLHGDGQVYRRHAQADRRVMTGIMTEFLYASREERYWPQAWPRWTLHTVEWGFCELSKYLRGLAGQKLKRKYRASELA